MSWKVLKGCISRKIETGERISASRKSQREKEYGNAVFASIHCAARKTLTAMSITYIGIQLSMVGLSGSGIDRIPVFTVILSLWLDNAKVCKVDSVFFG
jgi:hypothetical protein